MSTFRIAVVDADRCQPKKCAQECKRMCPVVAQGKECIEVTPTSVAAAISETLCNGCNICTKVCPFGAIQIINLPSELGKDKVHHYGDNKFSLYRLPGPRLNQVLGLMGRNGTGKTTSIKILCGDIIPNFGEVRGNYDTVIRHFRGSSLQDYFKLLSAKKMTLALKPQNLTAFSLSLGNGKVGTLLDRLGIDDSHVAKFGLAVLLEKEVDVLSGGELQRLAIASTVAKKPALMPMPTRHTPA